MNTRLNWLGCFALLVGLMLIPVAFARADTPAPAAQSGLKLFAVGDWGIDSPDRQTVADAMANANANPAAVLLLGDNFYVKVAGVDDPLWQKFFEKTYDAVRLNIPFYAVLGNHDYKGNDDTVELAYSARGHTRFTMPSRWYRLDLPAEHPIATILMLDSNQQALPKEQWDRETQWIDGELAKPHAKWLMCCAHHDMFGNGSHGDNGVLMTTWGPLFKKYHVDFYLCGHEHTLKHLEINDWPISFVIAGGGGAARKPLLRDQRGPFSRSVLGFAEFEFGLNAATVSLVDGTGATLHSFRRDADGSIHILISTPSDKASDHPLQVINGIDPKGGKDKGGD